MKKAKIRNDLSTAQVLFAKKKYGQVISLLIPQIVLYRKEREFHEILGLACLHNGDFGGALSYLQRSRDIEPRRVPTLLALALVLARRRKINEALLLWLEVLEIEPGNAQAEKALELAKTFSEEDWRQYIEDGRYLGILTHPQRYIAKRLLLPLGLGMLIVAGISALIALLVNIIPNNLPYRENAELLEFEQSDFTSGDYSQFASIIFTEGELDRKLMEIQRLYHRYRDNLVRYNGNQVLMSNAPLSVKDRISFIISQLAVPDFTNFQDNFSYADVADSPAVHNGVYVRWQGRAANLQQSEEFINFDFLVGFETGRVVQGTVPVQVDFALSIAGGEALEVIARVNSAIAGGSTSASNGAEGAWSLSATGIRRLGE